MNHITEHHRQKLLELIETDIDEAKSYSATYKLYGSLIGKTKERLKIGFFRNKIINETPQYFVSGGTIIECVDIPNQDIN